MSVTFIAKDGGKIQIDKQILLFAASLEPDADQTITFKETITTKFLQIAKDFYEKNEFNKDKMQVKKAISGTNLSENLITKINTDIMKPIYDKALETKNLEEIIDLSVQAEYFKAPEIVDLIKITFGSIIFCGDTENEQTDYCTKWDIQLKQPAEMIEEIYTDPKKEKVWKDISDVLYDQYQSKLKEIVNPPNQQNAQQP